MYLNIRPLSQGIIILNDNSMLEWNGDNDGILDMIYADSLCKRDTMIDHMKDDYEDIFLCVGDVGFGYMRDESEIFLRISIWMMNSSKKLRTNFDDVVMMWMTFHASKFEFAIKRTAKRERLL